MKKIFTLSLILFSAVLFSACTHDKSETEAIKTNTTGLSPAADQKSGDTTKTGTITTAGGKFFLTEAGQTPKEIESYQVQLGDYVGQTVTVVGQYSGDTLFVGSVK
jgi:ABC-type Fe3+-hydroxamate transport system substrate-binding protein